MYEDWVISFNQFAYDYMNMIGYDLPNRQLDKDILIKGNKVYSKDTCVLVPPDINKLLLNSKNIRGKYPVGVWYDASRDKYATEIKKHGKKKHLGRYDTPEEAFGVYKIAKESHIKEMAELYKSELDPRAYNALMNWIISDTD
jgi:hypothetical protein